MSQERTFVMIKPNAVNKNVLGACVGAFESHGLHVVAIKKLRVRRAVAEAFYAEHKERPFFPELVDFICSGPVVAMVLEGENAVKKAREIMGDTNPEKAAEGTLRKLYGDNVGENATHGSDSLPSAEREIPFFFSEQELI